MRTLQILASFSLTFTLGCATTQRSTEPTPVALAAPDPYLATLTVDAAHLSVFAAPDPSSAVLEVVAADTALRLMRRDPAWFFVRTPSGASGYVQPEALVASQCTHDRPEPRALEVPVFRFGSAAHGVVVIEAEFTSSGALLASHVVQNTTRDPQLEAVALQDLNSVRFLAPTKGCEPQAFIYRFTRHF
jgi:hypothetical protein